jgi:hypothetical protein
MFLQFCGAALKATFCDSSRPTGCYLKNDFCPLQSTCKYVSRRRFEFLLRLEYTANAIHGPGGLTNAGLLTFPETSEIVTPAPFLAKFTYWAMFFQYLFNFSFIFNFDFIMFVLNSGASVPSSVSAVSCEKIHYFGNFVIVWNLIQQIIFAFLYNI